MKKKLYCIPVTITIIYIIVLIILIVIANDCDKCESEAVAAWIMGVFLVCFMLVCIVGLCINLCNPNSISLPTYNSRVITHTNHHPIYTTTKSYMGNQFVPNAPNPYCDNPYNNPSNSPAHWH